MPPSAPRLTRPSPSTASEYQYYHYDYASTKLLRTFLEQRTGCPPPKLDKLCYIQRLIELDERWTFRFLDLPPEVRNLIYGHLLRLRPALREGLHVCSPEILATCKQTQREAQQLLYSENVFEMRIQSVAFAPSKRACLNSTTIKFAKLETDDLIFRDAAIEDINAAWPMYIRKAESIRLILKLNKVGFEEGGRSEPSFVQLNHILHSLALLEEGGSAVKRVHVMLKPCAFGMPQSVSQSIFYPIAAFKKLGEAGFSLEGATSGTADYLKRTIRDRPADFNSMASVQSLRSERRKATKLYMQALGAGLKAPVLQHLAERARSAAKVLGGEETYWDEAYYTKVEASIAVLQSCFDDPATREVDATLSEHAASE